MAWSLRWLIDLRHEDMTVEYRRRSPSMIGKKLKGREKGE